MIDAFLDDRHRLEQHGERLYFLGNPVQVLGRLDVELRHEPMPAHDAALGVLAAAAAVVLPAVAVRAFSTRTSHRGDHQVARLPPGDLLADIDDDAEVLVAEDQELFAVRRLAVQAMVDLRIRSTKTNAEHLDGDMIRRHDRIRHVPHVDAVFLSRTNDDRFHVLLRLLKIGQFEVRLHRLGLRPVMVPVAFDALRRRALAGRMACGARAL